MRNVSRHTEWLSLVEVAGPFLAIPVLEKVFPQGLDVVETPKSGLLRRAYEEWCDAVDESDPKLNELHREWIRLVFEKILEYDERILIPRSAQDSDLIYTTHDRAGTFVPDWALRRPNDGKNLLLVSVQPPRTDLDGVRSGERWLAAPLERMTLLCRATGVRLGIVTDGERWVLVDAPVGENSSIVSWYARLWFQEPITLKAFASLLGVRRFFGPEDGTLPMLLQESLAYAEEVTDTLGEQVRRAVELLVQCLDKANQARNDELLRNVSPAELYEAGLTVMMRLVFSLCAEERGLSLLGDPIYDRHYALSTLRGRLTEEADRYGPEVLERRHDAWARLLAVFRAIHGGMEHETLRMPALGGSLFDPDRFPFLEGRPKGSHWRDKTAAPLPIDNRTVLLLLNALQVLERHGGALTLSYKALDVEQIGHVYEGLLEHTVMRLPQVTLSLVGSNKAKNPNLTLVEMEKAVRSGERDLVELVNAATGRTETAIENALKKEVDEATAAKLLFACDGDTELVRRVRPFAHLLRKDAWGAFIVYKTGSFAVTIGADRRETGTHYTPKSLTESVVEATLESVVYTGPAEGEPRERWQLKSSAELLDLKICDSAMGSGAFLVQVCRWLAERLVEAWGKEEAAGKTVTMDGKVEERARMSEPMPPSLDERLLIARRLIAERCLYGVDINPLSVELAKLSIWLVTLAKGRPFGFLDHNLRHGDTLLGIHRLQQLTHLEMNPEYGKHQVRIFEKEIMAAVQEAIALRKSLREITIRDIRDVEAMARLDLESRKKLAAVETVADAMIGEAFQAAGNAKALESALENLSKRIGNFLDGDTDTGTAIAAESRQALSIDLAAGKPPRKPFHWALEFPEVFENGGFDAIVGNPPFMGGQKITGNLGTVYRDFLVAHLAGGKKGSADLCAYFFLRNATLLRKNGMMGLLATKTIAQGDTREVGLEQLEKAGYTIVRGVASRKWPGTANLEVAYVWIRRGEWKGVRLLDDKPATGIGSFLTQPGQVIGNPYRLKANADKSFQGSIVLGMGFVLEPEAAQSLIAKDFRNEKVLFPYLSGEDLNSRSDQSPSRWVINFFDWPLQREGLDGTWKNADAKQKKQWLQDGTAPTDYPDPVAADYPDCLAIVEAKVKPERTRIKNDGKFVLRKPLPQRWWIYAEKRPKLYSTIAGMNRVLVHGFVSKYLAFGFVPNGIVYAGPMNVIAYSSYNHFAILQSTIDETWVRGLPSALENRMRFLPGDHYETFPFPQIPKELEDIGQRYYEHRQKIMESRQEGLTATYNRFHKPKETTADIQKLRELHMEMDKAVAVAYGWNDLDLGHGFHETKQGLRFTICETARQEVLQRLLQLNHERYAEEVRQGLHEKTKKAVTRSNGELAGQMEFYDR
jgi:hypothetical protein